MHADQGPEGVQAENNATYVIIARTLCTASKTEQQVGPHAEPPEAVSLQGEASERSRVPPGVLRRVTGTWEGRVPSKHKGEAVNPMSS